MVCPYPFDSVQGTIWLPDSGPVLHSSLSTTHSVCPSLAVWGRPTSCCGDICLHPQSGGADMCGMREGKEEATGSFLQCFPSHTICRGDVRKLASDSRVLGESQIIPCYLVQQSKRVRVCYTSKLLTLIGYQSCLKTINFMGNCFLKCVHVPAFFRVL